MFLLYALCATVSYSVVVAALLSKNDYNDNYGAWKQDRFAISMFVDPIVPPDRFDSEYQRIANANFTVLLGGFGAVTPSTVTQQVAAAKKNGLIVLPSICNGACANISDTNVWGFQIADEPNVSSFNTVATLVADAKANGKMAFVNLLPNYATPEQLGAETYRDYVDIFMKVVQPNMLCMDHYPQFDQATTGNATKAGYISNLLVLREAAASVEPNIPFWNFFNAMPFNQASQFDVSEAELRWQIYTSLAIGAKGVLYFSYWTPPGPEFLRGQAIMTPTPGCEPDISNQSPGNKFPMVQRINSKLRVLGNWLFPKVSSAVVQASGDRTSTILLNQLPWNSISGSLTGPQFDFLLGCYDENKTVLLVNQDSNHPALATVGGMDSTTLMNMMEVDSNSGDLIPARDDSPFLPGFQIALLAGDGRLFTWTTPENN